MSYSNLYKQYLGIDPDEANKNYLPQSYGSMGQNSGSTDAINAMIGSSTPQISAGTKPGSQVGWFESAASPFANLFGNKMSNALVNAVKGQLSPKSGFVSDVGAQFGMSAGDAASSASQTASFGSDFLSSLGEIDPTAIGKVGLDAILGATGIGNTKYGKGVKAGASVGVAGAQGFTNPISDFAALASLFDFGRSFF